MGWANQAKDLRNGDTEAKASWSLGPWTHWDYHSFPKQEVGESIITPPNSMALWIHITVAGINKEHQSSSRDPPVYPLLLEGTSCWCEYYLCWTPRNGVERWDEGLTPGKTGMIKYMYIKVNGELNSVRGVIVCYYYGGVERNLCCWISCGLMFFDCDGGDYECAWHGTPFIHLLKQENVMMVPTARPRLSLQSPTKICTHFWRKEYGQDFR